MSTIWMFWLGKSSNAQQQTLRGKDLDVESVRKQAKLTTAETERYTAFPSGFCDIIIMSMIRYPTGKKFSLEFKIIKKLFC